MRSLSLWLLSTIIVGPATAARAQQSLVDLSVVSWRYTVQRVPAEVRDVPIHPDDDYASRDAAGPIGRERYAARVLATLGFTIMRGSLGRVHHGAKLNWIAYPNFDFNSSKALRNYTNDVGSETRGYGAALTFASLEARGAIPTINALDAANILLNFAPEYFAELRLGRSAGVGTALSYYRMQMVTGWDRYDSREIRRTDALSHHFPLTFAARLGPAVLGAQWQLSRHTSLGRRGEITHPPVSLLLSLRSRE